MPRRSRKPPVGAPDGGTDGARLIKPAADSPVPEPAETGRRLRGEERNEALRAELVPLGPDERPAALRISAAVAAVLALLNVAFWAAGVEVGGEEPQLSGVLIFAALMLVAAWGIWDRRYWAVLGFQALLAVTVVVAALSLMVASNLLAVVLCVGIIASGGWLFWKLVRVLGRMKVPRIGA